MIIDDIQLKVEEHVNTMPEIVIGVLMEKARKCHVSVVNNAVGRGGTSECDCEYCRTLRLYVTTKISMHRSKRRLYREDSYSIAELPDMEQRFLQLQETVRFQRKQAKLAAIS
jgi:hypothetical protein